MFPPGIMFRVLVNSIVHQIEVDRDIMTCSYDKFKES